MSSQPLFRIHNNGEVPISKVLRLAARELQAHGHCKNRLVTPDGEMCVRGAINKVLTGNPETFLREYNTGGRLNGDKPIMTAIKSALRLPLSTNNFCGGDDPGAVVAWNNDKDRTQREVIEGLNQTADALDDGEVRV